MRILIVSRYKDNFPSHIVPFVQEQGAALVAKGHDVSFFQVKGSYLRRKDLRNAIKTFNPDVIHAHYGLSGITAVLQDRIPVVTTFHNGEISSALVNFSSSLFSLRAKHVIYVARHIYDKCYFTRKDRFSIIPCGVDLSECVITEKCIARTELGFSQDKKYVLFGGAFDNLRKNYPLLKQAIELLDENIACIEMKGLTRAQVSKLLCACDAFALPSKSEGSPQALKEAMACNCPIVATDIADIKHLLGDLPGHYICSFDPADVAEKLRRAINFEGRTNGRDRIVELGLTNDVVADRLLSVYKSVL